MNYLERELVRMLKTHDRVSTTQTMMIYLVEKFAEKDLIDKLQLMSPFTFFPFEATDVIDIEMLDERDHFLDVVFVLKDGRRFTREGTLIAGAAE